MVAIMRYSMGLNFTGIVCEDESTARKYLIEDAKDELINRINEYFSETAE